MNARLTIKKIKTHLKSDSHWASNGILAGFYSKLILLFPCST